MGYLIIREDKTPSHKFKDTDGRPWEDVKDFDNIAEIVPSPFVVYDFDNAKEADIMFKIVKALGIKTKVMKTNKGIHCWFRNEEKMKCVTRNRTAIGLHFDRKSHSSNAYVVIKRSGQMREILQDCPLDDIDPIPSWLGTVNNYQEEYDFPMLQSGSRNDTLFRYILVLQSNGFKKDEVKGIIRIINTYVLDEPLPDREIDIMLRDDSFKSDEEIQQYQDEKSNKFNHVELGEKLKEDYDFVTINSNLYLLEDGVYKRCELLIKQKLNKMRYGITENQRIEVLNYLKSETFIDPNDLTYNPYELAIRGKKINVKTSQLLDYGEHDYMFTRLDVDYNPNAKCPAVDKVLNNVFLGDKELIELFYEAVGTCFVRKSIRETAFIFLGDGSNGKSTIIEMLQFLFKGCYASLDLSELSTDVGIVELENKLVNLGDDINGVTIRNTGKIKKVIAGNSVFANRKYQPGANIISTATHIFSANSIPHSTDKSSGFYRRFKILPFNANFNDNKKNFNANVLEGLCTEEAKSYLLLKGIQGIQKVLKTGKFTESQAVAASDEEYRISNSNVLTWIDEEDLDEVTFLTKPMHELYSIFSDWCSNSNTSPSGRKAFYTEVRKHFNFEKDPIQKRTNGLPERYFQMKI